MIIHCVKCMQGIVFNNDKEWKLLAHRCGWEQHSEYWVCGTCCGKTKIKETGMKIKIGEAVEHGGQNFVVVEIKHHATMDGVMLNLIAYDPEMANKEQQKAIKMDQTSQNVIDMLKKITEGGGLNLGGMIGG